MPPPIARKWFALLALVAIANGCHGKSASDTGDATQIRAAMKVLGLEYGNYLTEHNGTPPQDQAAMRSYLQSHLTNLSDYGVKSVDQLMRAGRDGQPIQIVAGAKIPAPDKPEYVWAAYEQTGVDGKRLVSDSRGGVTEVIDEEFSKRVPQK